MTDWRPSASLEALQARAELLRVIRRFFHQRAVLELETPVIGPGNVPDPHVTGLVLQTNDPQQPIHLQTSPELFMKRFVAAERVSCFQITKAFRVGERGRQHNPEFTLLEWYRVDWGTSELIQEVVELIQTALAIGAEGEGEGEGGSEQPPPEVFETTYRDLFNDSLGIDPIKAPTADLVRLAQRHGAPETDRLGALSYLLSAVIEPTFPARRITVVDRFPADQAALARATIDADGEQVAERFEVYLGATELANGYGELTDAQEQADRFSSDKAKRLTVGLPDAGSQEQLIAALRHGLPTCSGVALGVDRLLMAMLAAVDLSQVVAFR